MKFNAINQTGLKLSRLGFGASPLGELFRSVDEAQSTATLDAAWNGGIRYFDTSPWYGLGLSEHRLGHFLRQKTRGDFVVSTKVGRLLKPSILQEPRPWHGGLRYAYHFDYSYDGIMRSFEDSLQRLGLDRIDILLIHDLDAPNLGGTTALTAHFNSLITSGFRALEQLRAAGDIAAVGAGVNERGMIPQIAEHCALDIVLYALRYSLAEHESVVDDMQYCLDHQIAVVAGGVFNSGLYATGPLDGITYNYREPTEAELDRAKRIQAICINHGVTLADAAVQFPLYHPAVKSVVVGADHPDQIKRNLAAFEAPVPEALWRQLQDENLVRRDAPLSDDTDE